MCYHSNRTGKIFQCQFGYSEKIWSSSETGKGDSGCYTDSAYIAVLLSNLESSPIAAFAVATTVGTSM